MIKPTYVRGVVVMAVVAAGIAVISLRAPGTDGGAGLGVRSASAATPKPNACGCYRDETGACFCGKKGKCACPGDCEPKGCEEKRAKQFEKEIAAETKKAAAGKSMESVKVSKATGAAAEPGEDSGDADADAKVNAKAKGKAARLSAAQKKELLRLLDAYLAEHPEGKSQTVTEIRATVGGH